MARALATTHACIAVHSTLNTSQHESMRSSILVSLLMMAGFAFGQSHTIDEHDLYMSGDVEDGDISINTYFNAIDAVQVNWSIIETDVPEGWGVFILFPQLSRHRGPAGISRLSRSKRTVPQLPCLPQRHRRRRPYPHAHHHQWRGSRHRNLVGNHRCPFRTGDRQNQRNPSLSIPFFRHFEPARHPCWCHHYFP